MLIHRLRKDTMATILEALQNAEYNIKKGTFMGIDIAKEQLYNSVTLLEKGYDIHDEVEPLLQKYGTIDKVPEKV